MMKRLAALFFVATLVSTTFFASEAQAQRHPGDFGIGIGSTTLTSGLSLKQIAGPTALQLTAGCWRSCDGLAASLDLLTPMPPLASSDLVVVGWNFGIGAAVGVADDRLGLAGTFVAGLEAIIQPVPFDLVFEWRPSLHIAPDVDVDVITFGGHLRFYP